MSITVRRDVLLDDPVRPGMAAVVRSGHLLFLSSIDGVTDHRTGAVDHSVFGDGPAQARRAYGAAVERLQECGLDGSAAVRIEHATASQDWRLQRMALWPEYFGVPTTAVSQGYQGKMAGRNMITVAVVAADPELERTVITPGPNQGRASRITRVGPWTFVIGVRGETSLATGDKAEEETPGAFAMQTRFSFDNIAHHLAAGKGEIGDVVRYDGFVRDVNRIDELKQVAVAHCGPLTAANALVGCPLGGATDLELSAMALTPGGEAVRLTGAAGDPVVVAEGLAFTSGLTGDRDVEGALDQQSLGDLDVQLTNALARVAADLERGGSRLEDALRLDVYLSDQYQFDRVDRALVERFGGDAPAVVRHGVELGATALVGLAAIGATTPHAG